MVIVISFIVFSDRPPEPSFFPVLDKFSKNIQYIPVVFNNDYTKRIVLSYLDKSDTIKSEYIQYWITSLYTAINENNIADEEELLSLLNKAARSQSEICNQIGKQIFSLFSES